jgi:MFS family permease
MPATPAGLVRRFALLSALRWFPIGLTIPVNILLMQARGLDLAAIGGLYAIYGVVTIALELPTGGLADVMGRRTVLVAAAVATTVSMLIAAFAQDAPMFALALTLAATGRALGSGPLDAWYVDATHAIDPEASVRHGLSRGQAAEALALGLGAIIGGLLPAICLSIWPSLTSGPIIGLSVPLLVAAAMTAANGVAIVLVVHEQRPAWIGARAIAGGIPSTIRDGLRLGLGDPLLRRLMVRAALLGVVLAGIELLAPGTFAALLGGEEQASRVYGIFAATAFAANAAGSALAPAVARRLGGARAAALASFAAGAAILLVASPFLALVGAGYVAVYLMLGVGGPLASELLHGRVAAAQRTTMLSVESLALQVGGVVANLSLGAIVVATSLGWGFACIAAAMVAGGALLLTRPFRQAAAVVDLARPAPAHEAG